jgi:hypothetical protein
MKPLSTCQGRIVGIERSEAWDIALWPTSAVPAESERLSTTGLTAKADRIERRSRTKCGQHKSRRNHTIQP